eukprot:scaffold3374_cov387-Prasinococcus_capsulatus_cf.AAC.4
MHTSVRKLPAGFTDAGCTDAPQRRRKLHVRGPKAFVRGRARESWAPRGGPGMRIKFPRREKGAPSAGIATCWAPRGSGASEKTVPT